MWQAKAMDKEPAVDWQTRLQQMVDGGCVLRIERDMGVNHHRHYVDLRRWESGQYAVVVRQNDQPTTAPVLVCNDFAEALEEFEVMADELFPEACDG